MTPREVEGHLSCLHRSAHLSPHGDLPIARFMTRIEQRILAAPFKKTGEIAKNPISPDPKGAMSTEGKVVSLDFARHSGFGTACPFRPTLSG